MKGKKNLGGYKIVDRRGRKWYSRKEGKTRLLLFANQHVWVPGGGGK